jgi:hypothetical protein
LRIHRQLVLSVAGCDVGRGFRQRLVHLLECSIPISACDRNGCDRLVCSSSGFLGQLLGRVGFSFGSKSGPLFSSDQLFGIRCCSKRHQRQLGFIGNRLASGTGRVRHVRLLDVRDVRRGKSTGFVFAQVRFGNFGLGLRRCCGRRRDDGGIGLRRRRFSRRDAACKKAAA